MLKYLKQEPHQVRGTLQKGKDHQATRKSNVTAPQQNLKNWFNRNASARNYRLSPQIRALCDVLSDAMDDCFGDDPAIVHNLDTEDGSFLDILDEVDLAHADDENFHDTDQGDEE